MGCQACRPLLVPNTFDPPPLQSFVNIVTVKEDSGTPLLRANPLKRNQPLTHPIRQCSAANAEQSGHLVRANTERWHT